jgi:hypothetical protein
VAIWIVEFLKRGGGTQGQVQVYIPRYGQNSGPVAENGAGLPNHIDRYPILYDMDYGVPPQSQASAFMYLDKREHSTCTSQWKLILGGGNMCAKHARSVCVILCTGLCRCHPPRNMYPCLLGTTYSYTGTVLPLLSYNSTSSTYMCAVTEANQGCDNSAPAN